MILPSFSIGTGLTLAGLIQNGKSVALFENNSEILTDCILMEVDATDDAKTMDHPIEDGAVVTDHIVFNPKQVTLRCVLPETSIGYERALREIKILYEQSREVTVKIRSDVYSSLIMTGKPVRVAAETLERITYELSFKQIITAVSQYVPMPVSIVKHKQDASTISSGEKQPQKSGTLLLSAAKGIVNWIKGK